MDGYSLKRLIRKPWLSIVSFVVAGAMCFLLCVLSSYRSKQTRELENIKKNYEVTCVFTDAKGTRSESLRMAERYTDFITDKEIGLGSYIRELIFVKEFNAVVGTMADAKLYGVSSERCDVALDQASGGDYHCEMVDFFESEEPVCIVSKSLYDQNYTDSLNFLVIDPYNYDGPGQMQTTMKIVGWHNGDEKKLFMPYPAAQKLGLKIALHACTDYAAFILNDNSKIDEIYETASELFPKVDPNSVDPGYAITVHDQQYRATMASIKQNIARTGYLLPVISLLGLAAGFLAGFLGTKGETRNYALMRTMGLTGARLFVTVLFEQQILSFIACVAVAFITKRPLPAAAFFLCNMVGTALAVLKPVLAPPTKLLRDQQ